MKGHLDIKTISDYFLNRLSSQEETVVQEHLSSCRECARKLEQMRKLRQAFFDEEEAKSGKPAFTVILTSGWTKAAAAIVVVAGIGLFSYQAFKDRDHILEQHRIHENRLQDEVFAIDTFDKEDTLYYLEKYGEDFKF